MLRLSLLVTLIATFFNLQAQTLYLKGSVCDYKNEPLEFVTVTLKNSTIVASAVSDKLGNFEIKTTAGNYQLTLSLVGKNLLTKEIDLRKSLNMGAIRVNASLTLNEVTIVSNKPLLERKIDRIIFNVENSIASHGSDALDILRITPNINIKSDEILMIGKSGMSVTINNRQLMLSGDDLINYLKNIRSEEIKNIEVITNPPSRYAAAGNSGIININLKKPRLNNWTASIGASLRQSKYLQGSQSASFAYNKHALSAYGNFSRADGLYLARTEKNLIWYTDQFYDSYSKIKTDYSSNFNLVSGLDYNINKRLSIGMQYSKNKNKLTEHEENDTKIYSSKSYLLATGSATQRDYKRRIFNAHSTYSLDSTGGSITINVDYFKYAPDQDRLFQTRYYKNFINESQQDNFSAQNNSLMQLENLATQLDIEQNIGNWNIAYGGKLSRTINKSNINFFDLNTGVPIFEKDKSDVFKYTENISALYLSTTKKINPQWEVKLGARLEKTKTSAISHSRNQTTKNDYLNLFPTLYLLYSPNSNNSISLNYGRRINRPNYQSLNPFIRYINQYTTSEGNPFLQSYYTDNIEFTHLLRKKLSTTIYFSKSQNKYDQVNYINNDNINNVTKYQNFFDDFSSGATESISFKPLRFWESTNSANLYYRKIKSSLPQAMASFSSWSAFFKTNNDFTLNTNNTIISSISYWCQLPDYYSISKTKAYSSLDLGLKALFLNKQLNMSIYCSDIFRSVHIRTRSTFDGILNTFGSYEDRQALRLSISYTIGKNENKQKPIKSSNDEEKGRAN